MATTPEAFIAIALKLIDDEAWRNAVVQKIRSIDLSRQLFETGHARYFKNAIDAIVAHHAQGKRRARPKKALIIPAATAALP